MYRTSVVMPYAHYGTQEKQIKNRYISTVIHHISNIVEPGYSKNELNRIFECYRRACTVTLVKGTFIMKIS